MIIECKKCRSMFRLDEGLLREEGSKVRCSVCKHVFVAFPPGLETGKKEELRPSDRTLGDTVTLKSPPAFEKQEEEPLPEDLSDADFGVPYEEIDTKTIEAGLPGRTGEEEVEEGFHLDMDYRGEEEGEPKPAVVKEAKPEREPVSQAREAKEARPKALKEGRSRLPVVIFVVLVLLLGGAGAVVLLAPDMIRERLPFLKGAPKQESKDPGVLRLRFTAVNGSFVQNSKAGQLFVVRGTISNNYSQSRSHVLVKGSILDDKGKVVKTKVAYAGNTFTDSELKDLVMDEINQGLRNKAGKGNVNVNLKPQASVPFMIVFEDLPENLSEFTVEPVSSSPGQ